MTVTDAVMHTPGDADVRRTVAGFLAGHPGDGRYLATIAGPGKPLAACARAAERRVFDLAVGPGRGAALIEAEYSRYDDRSLYLLVLDRHAQDVAGAARVIEGTGSGVKTVDDAATVAGQRVEDLLARHGMRGELVWDFATLAVLPDYRGGDPGLAVSTLLYRTFLVAGRNRGVRHAVAMLDRNAYRGAAKLGVPLRPLAGAEPFAYLNSPETRAVHADFPQITRAVAAQAGAHRWAARPGWDLVGAAGRERIRSARRAARAALQIGTGRGVDHLIGGS